MRTQVAIIGAGLIGCEFANDLAAGGYAVDIIDIAQQALGRLLPPEGGAMLKRCGFEGLSDFGGLDLERRKVIADLTLHYNGW